MYLLDTNVISETRKNRPHGALLAWLETIDKNDIFLSAATFGELQAGIELTRRQNTSKAEELERWVDNIADSYQILPMEIRTFREWARLMNGRSNDLLEDAMLAATARIHRLTVVTRNTRDFRDFNVPLLNPFTAK